MSEFVPRRSALGAWVLSPHRARKFGAVVESPCLAQLIEVIAERTFSSPNLQINVYLQHQFSGSLNGSFGAWTERTELGIGAGVTVGEGSTDTTKSICNGGFTVATPDGYGRRVNNFSGSFDETPENLIRLQLGDYLNLVDLTFCASTGDIVWMRPETVTSVMANCRMDLQENIAGPISLCGGGTESGPFTRAEFRYFQPNDAPTIPGSASLITEAIAQGTVEEWDTSIGNPVIDFAGIPQGGTSTGCYTAGAGGWYRHGPGPNAGQYTWTFVTAGNDSQTWDDDQQILMRPAGPWPLCEAEE